MQLPKITNKQQALIRLTLQANIEGIGWDEEGLVFTVPNMFTEGEARIDLREPPGEIPNN